MPGEEKNRERQTFVLGTLVLVLLFLMDRYACILKQICFAMTARVRDRSFRPRQGLFWPWYPSFIVGAVSQGVFVLYERYEYDAMLL